MDACKHNDCWNFVTVDVAKGICRRRGELVAIDTPVCKNFRPLPKCKNCAHFAPGSEEGIGVCGAELHKPWTYPELIAVTCEMYAPGEGVTAGHAAS
jgi:4-hydroxyphenylacetate decarboxylase small subunit